MSVALVHDSLVDILRASLVAEFNMSLTGTVTSLTTTITGIGTLFTTELNAGDYIGNAIKGFRRVSSIVSDTSLTIDSAFLTEFAGAAISKTDINKGIGKGINLTRVGRLLRVTFNQSLDLDVEAARKAGLASSPQRVWTVLGFVIALGFYEPNEVIAEDRKSAYDKAIRDAIDNNMDIKGTCVALTKFGNTTFSTSPDVEGLYFGAIPIICYRREERGNR